MAYFSYEKYINPILENNKTKTLIISDLRQSESFILTTEQPEEKVFQLELEIKGKSDEIIHLYFGKEKNVFIKDVGLKNGEIDYTTILDWYNDTAYIKIDGGNKGELTIDYRFLSL